MANVIRLKRWKTYMEDGRGSVDYSTLEKDKVALFIQVGYEPAALKSIEERADIESVILEMADWIRAKNKKAAAAKKEAEKAEKPKKKATKKVAGKK